MRALPARRIALGALCAALLVTTTGPAALAADSHPGQEPAASLLARLPQTDTARTDLTPVTDLVRAVLSAPDGQLPPAEARRLAAAAREAVARAATDDPSSTSVTVVNNSSAPAAPVLPGVPNPATGVLLPTAEEDDTPAAATDVLGAVREALENLLDVLLPKSDPADAGSASTATTESSSTSTTETDDTGTTGTTDDTSTTDTSASTDTTESTGGADTTDEVAAAVNASETAAGAAADAALTATDALVARVDELLAVLAGTDAQTATTLPAPADPVASSSSAAPAEPAASPGLLPALTSLLTPNS
ncbi:hypothetical protein ACH3WN_01535 [Streptomyces albogriseolus]|uniref:hypothetical protein n=1 Tax=Streptomyces albogriseolus TaxID=1887 RepID=UPI0037AF398A